MGMILGQILTQITRLFSNFFLNLGQFLTQILGKFDPYIYIPNFVRNKGSLIYQEAYFAVHVGGTSL